MLVLCLVALLLLCCLLDGWMGFGEVGFLVLVFRFVLVFDGGEYG